MSPWVSELINRYTRLGVLVDTNILLLYFVGQFNPAQIARHRRTRQFTKEDFVLLAGILRRFDKIVTTPCILAEVSNLSAQIEDPAKTELFRHFAQEVNTLDEQHSPSATIAQAVHFPRLGLTDSGILDRARGTYLVLTDDVRLAGFLKKSKIDVLNFNHLRQDYWSR